MTRPLKLMSIVVLAALGCATGAQDRGLLSAETGTIERLYESIRRDDYQAFLELWAQSENIDFEKNGYRDPLLYAINVGASVILPYLLSGPYSGAKRQAVREQALNWAASVGSLDVFLLLVDAADSDWMSLHGGQALFNALEGRNREVVYYLLENGVDLLFQAEEGETLLFPAVIFGESDVVQVLLEAGADPDISVRGITALDLALERFAKDSEIVQLLSSRQ